MMAGISVQVIIWKRLCLKMANRQLKIICKVVVRDFKVVKVRDIGQKDHFFFFFSLTGCSRSLLHHAGSYIVAHGLQLWCAGFVASWHVGSQFPNQGSTLGPYIARQILHHWTTREVPKKTISNMNHWLQVMAKDPTGKSNQQIHKMTLFPSVMVIACQVNTFPTFPLLGAI